MAGYLFVHFTGEHKDGEQVYFSLSRDGLHWHDLNDGKPVLISQTGACGVRDPFVVRSPLDGRFYLIATDLRIESGITWKQATDEGSRDLIVWESEDLVHWSRERACTVGIPEAGCVWAPEAVFDRERQEFFVFFASNVKKDGETERKQRIYGCYTKDFLQFSETFCYIERDNHLIDTTILESGGSYYRITKDEEHSRLVLEKGETLLGEFTQVDSAVLRQLEGVEGPEGYLLPDGKSWCVIADRFREGLGYLPMITGDLASGVFQILDDSAFDMGTAKKRHGGILAISDEEYERLTRFYDRKYPVIEGLYADPDLYVEDGIWYLYPTTDGFPGWSGNRFFVFSSADGKVFQNAGELLDVSTEQVPWASGFAWAPCIAKKGGRYYFYFCAKDKEGVSAIGVAVGDSPTGPFRAEAQPLVTLERVRACGIGMVQTIDPSVYCEDGQYYLLFGNGQAAVARLAEDMVHIEEETLKGLEGLEDFRESVIVVKRNGEYHFTWSCDDTGSGNYHVNYGVSDSLYGPVCYVGTILEKDARRDVYGTGHHSILKLPGEDIWYIAYHRFATPTGTYPEGKGWHREVCLAPLVFDENNRIRSVIV